MNTLTTEPRRRLADALCFAYSSHADLHQMVRVWMDVNLEEICSPNDNLSICVNRLIEWAERKGRLAELIISAHQGNSGDPVLREFANSLPRTSILGGGRIPAEVDAIFGIAPRWSVLEDVHKAVGLPIPAEPGPKGALVAAYPARGLSVTCVRDPDWRWVVDTIALYAPCADKLSYSGLHIGMAQQDIAPACAGKYLAAPAHRQRSDFVVYEPLRPNGCGLSLALGKGRITRIFMRRP